MARLSTDSSMIFSQWSSPRRKREICGRSKLSENPDLPIDPTGRGIGDAQTMGLLASGVCDSFKAVGLIIMRIWRFHEFGPIENLQLDDIDTPEPQPGEALVRVEYAALNPADAFMVAGKYPRPGKPPYAVGRDGSGRIERVAECIAKDVQRQHDRANKKLVNCAILAIE